MKKLFFVLVLSITSNSFGMIRRSVRLLIPMRSYTTNPLVNDCHKNDILDELTQIHETNQIKEFCKKYPFLTPGYAKNFLEMKKKCKTIHPSELTEIDFETLGLPTPEKFEQIIKDPDNYYHT